MKAAFIPSLDDDARVPGRIAEAAPGRLRIGALKLLLVVVFCALGARAGQLAFSGEAPAARGAAQAGAGIVRADVVDRNGVLLATTIPGFALIAHPKEVWDPADVARKLSLLLPELDAAQVQKKLEQRERNTIQLKRDLTPRQKQQIFDLGLPGVAFADEPRRVYPQGDLAAHILGGVNAARVGVAGVERGLDAQIRRSGAAGQPVRLSLDVRVQHALERELAAGVKAAQAQGGAGIVLDARSGEVLAIASAPSFDPNAPPAPNNPVRLNRAAGAVYEMGSTMKPFTVAMAMDAQLTRPEEVFNVSEPLTLDDVTITDFHNLGRPAPLHEALAQSSNIMAAILALRVGYERQRETLRKLGLYDRSALQTPESAKPLTAAGKDRISIAVLGYGHGMAFSLASLAGAYTVFANDGARVEPTLLARGGEPAPKTAVFSKPTTKAVLAMMREAVVSGTAKRADVPGLEIAGKTGSAEKPKGGAYASDLLLSSFVAIFPAREPAYVIVVALDEPQRTAELGNLATGGAVAAPIAGRIAARIAPLLGIPANAGKTGGGESP